MTAALYDHNNTQIALSVTRVIPLPDTLEIEHRTLDGQYNIQQIGTAAYIVEVTAWVTLAGKRAIDAAKAIMAPLKVTGAGKYHIGPIRGRIEPEYFGPDLYRVSFTLLQQSEGAL